MNVDNIELAKVLMQFESEDDFYFLQVIQRKKENPQLGSNSRVIKEYYLKSYENLLDRYDEIKLLCQVFNARAALRVNKRSFEQTAFKTLTNIANTMQNREYRHIKSSYSRSCGLLTSAKPKKWIVDIDEGDLRLKSTIIESIEASRPFGKVIMEVPSKTGVHLVTNGFDIGQFESRMEDFLGPHTPHIDIHKDNFINLYI